MDEGTDDPAGDDPASGPADAPDGGAERAAVVELERLLLSHGPLTVEELAERVEAELPDLATDLVAGLVGGAGAARPGGDLLDEVTRIARQDDAFWRLPDGRLAPVLHHLRRATFTHRLTADELAREAVDLCPDLLALALPRTVELPDGTGLRTASSEQDGRGAAEGSLLGPSGWLGGRATGDLLAVHYDGEQVVVDPISEAALDEDAGREAGGALRRAHDALPPDRAPEVHRLVVDAIGTTPTAFATAVAPVRELLAAEGLRVRDVWAGPADRPWSTPAEQARRRRLDQLLQGADGCCRGAARRALDGWQDWMAELTPADAPRATVAGAPATGAAAALDPATAEQLAEDVDHGPTAPLLAEVATLGPSLRELRRLGDWATAVAGGSSRPRAGVEYLQAVGADAGGDGGAAEAHLEAGVAVDVEDAACLLLLAELAEDRGDAERSLGLLRRAGRPPGPGQRPDLEPFLADRNVGRNEPCPCGSGRKYKSCCWGRPIRRPLAMRAAWLLQKATRHTRRLHAQGIEPLRQFFAATNDDQQATALAEDMLLFASGGLERYLDTRGGLLPDDELACARAWVGRPMRLLELAGGADTAGPDAGGVVGLLDVATGERLRFADPAEPARVAPGGAVIARPLPVEDGWLLGVATIPVPDSGRAAALRMLEGEVRPVQLVELLVDLQVEAIRAGGLPAPGMPAGAPPGALPRPGPRLP